MSEQTLAEELLLPRPGEEGSPLSGLHLHPAKLGGQEVTLGLERSEPRGDG